MSGGGGGVIIIKSAIKSVMSDPLVSGNLPTWLAPQVSAICANDVDNWSDTDYHTMLFAFSYAATHA